MTNSQLRIRCAEAMGFYNVGHTEDGDLVGCQLSTMTGWHTIPPYDESADAALLLVARLKEQGWRARIDISAYGNECQFFRGIPQSDHWIHHEAEGETPAEAICHAFIKATQGETKL